MAHFLIVDDEKYVTKEWSNRLKQENHSCVTALDVDKALEAIKKSEQPDGEPFDLILLDHGLGEENGLDVIRAVIEVFDSNYWQHRIIVITGLGNNNLAREYAKFGAIGHLIKPVSEAQFKTAITAALERRAIYVDNQENWENAYQVLQDYGLLESLAELKADSANITQQYQSLKLIYDRLLVDLKEAGSKESQMALAYEKASDALNATSGGINSILIFLQNFQITASFWSDVEKIYYVDKLQFFVLQSYLKRIAENPLNYRIKHLGAAGGHYEYRIGRNYRLYFRRESGDIILERYGHKNLQEEIISCLKTKYEDVIKKPSRI